MRLILTRMLNFLSLDVDIDRKKDGAEMGLHEHFLGEAHAIH